MSDTQTDTPSHEQTANGEGTHRGKHRGEAAVSEDPRDLPARGGRHRRTAWAENQSAQPAQSTQSASSAA